LNMGIDKRLCIAVPEAAEMLGISRNFAYELARQGKLPTIRFGKRLLIPRAGLDKMLEKGA
jgi:excisionase family DNA binding protein